MGTGTGILLIVVGAILAFALNVEVSWLNFDVVGIVLMLAGAAMLLLTLWFWRSRRRRGVVSVVEEARLAHHSGAVPPDPPDAELGIPHGP
jgi:hypothetical protein